MWRVTSDQLNKEMLLVVKYGAIGVISRKTDNAHLKAGQEVFAADW